MRNKIRKEPTFLIAKGREGIAGMVKYEEEITFPHASEANLPLKVSDTVTAEHNYQQGFVTLRNRRLAFRAGEVETFQYVTLVREVLKPLLGNKPTQAWATMRLAGSFKLPRTAPGLLPMLEFIKEHLTANPSHAFENLEITTEKVTDRLEAFQTKRDEYNQQRGELNKLKEIRDEKASALERAIRLLLNDLHKKLTPTDPRWVEFGFKKPGARSTPDVPENLTAVLIGTNAISMKWAAAARATSYRVWIKVLGQDADFVPLESRSDLDHTIEGLPGNSTVEVAVSAMNNGGESKLSTVVTVMTL